MIFIIECSMPLIRHKYENELLKLRRSGSSYRFLEPGGLISKFFGCPRGAKAVAVGQMTYRNLSEEKRGYTYFPGNSDDSAS